jgi:hypothetical protein
MSAAWINNIKNRKAFLKIDPKRVYYPLIILLRQ